jgi:NADH dehydrogenase
LLLLAPVVVPIAIPFYAGIHGGFWFILKVSLYIYFFMWLRFTIPRYRFDQLMRLGWHFLIPLSIVNVLLVGVALIAGSYWNLHGWGLLLVTTPAAIVTLIVAFLILAMEKGRGAPQGQTAASDFYAG